MKNERKSILYNIFVPQERIIMIAPKLSLESAVILDYISRWELYSRDKSRKAVIKGEEYIWLHYPTLIQNLPILKIRSKDRITRRINELVKLGLLKREQLKDNTLYIKLTDLAASLYLAMPNLSLKPGQPVVPIRTDLSPQQGQHNTTIKNTTTLKESNDSFEETPGLPKKKKRKTERVVKGEVSRIINTFIDYVKSIKGFTPVVNRATDGKIVKIRLNEFTEDDLIEAINWYLSSDLADKWGVNLKTALCASAINKWQAQREY